MKTLYLTTDDLSEIKDEVYYVLVNEDDNVGGIALGSYIKRDIEKMKFYKYKFSEVSNEQAESIMWNL